MNSIYHINAFQSDPTIKIKGIIKDAVKFAIRGDFQGMIGALERDYEPKKSLLIFSREAMDICPKRIIKVLLNFGYRADGIALVLNYIGEALGSGEDFGTNLTQTDLISKAREVLRSIYCEELFSSAMKEDENYLLGRTSKRSMMWRDIWNFIIADGGKKCFPQGDIDGVPNVVGRLYDMIFIAKINEAIFYLDSTSEQDRKASVDIAEKARLIISTDLTFTRSSESKLESLEDLIWILSGHHVRLKTIEDVKENC